MVHMESSSAQSLDKPTKTNRTRVALRLPKTVNLYLRNPIHSFATGIVMPNSVAGIPFSFGCIAFFGIILGPLSRRLTKLFRILGIIFSPQITFALAAFKPQPPARSIKPIVRFRFVQPTFFTLLHVSHYTMKSIKVSRFSISQIRRSRLAQIRKYPRVFYRMAESNSLVPHQVEHYRAARVTSTRYAGA